MKAFNIDITKKFEKQLMRFNGSIDELIKFYKMVFDLDSIPYNGIKRWGLDSSTETSDITYDDLEVGHYLYWRKYTKNGFKWFKIKITQKYNGIIFFETIGEKKNKKSYIDTGANDFEWDAKNPMRYKIPQHTFYPIKLIKPSWVDIEDWNAPKSMIVENI